MSDRNAADAAGPEVLARLMRAAEEAGLGRRVAGYGWQQSWLPMVAFVVFGAISALMVVVGALVVALILGGVALIPLAAFVLGRIHLARGDHRLDIFEFGLTITKRKKVSVARFDTTKFTQNITVHVRSGAPNYTIYSYTLTDLAGSVRAISGGTGFVGSGFERPVEWGAEVQHRLTAIRLPLDRAALDRGDRVDYGSMWLRTAEIGTRFSSWPLADIAEVRVEEGRVELYAERRGTIKSISSTSVGGVKNIGVFLTLADALCGPPAGRG